MYYLFIYLFNDKAFDILYFFFPPEITFCVWIPDTTSCKPKADSELSLVSILQSWNKSINVVIWG